MFADFSQLKPIIAKIYSYNRSASHSLLLFFDLRQYYFEMRIRQE